MLGGGAGSIMDMIARLRNNRNLLRKKSVFNKDKGYFENERMDVKSKAKGLHFKKASEAELKIFRKKLKTEKRKDGIITFLVATAIATFLSLIVVIIYKNEKKEFSKINEQREKDIFLDKKENYTCYLNEGNEWLSKKNWYMAKLSFHEALKYFPDDYVANLCLAQSYTFICKENNRDCQLAIEKLNYLIKMFPDSIQAYQIRANFYQILGEQEKALADLDRIEILKGY